MPRVTNWGGLLERHAVACALIVLTALIAMVIWRASLVVDGTRYFWLDDDQMISMRYARHLAQGDGLVWNPGERVEGYTSLGWVLVMAVVHLLPVADAWTALVVKVVGWLLACAVVVTADRLLHRLTPRPGLARPAVLLTLVLSADLVFWTGNGFETPLLTLVFMAGLLRIFREGEREAPGAWTLLLIGLLPVARSDAYHLWGASILCALGWSRNRRTLIGRLPLALVVPGAHVAFRLLYYGDWLPNTYYLKVAGVDGLFWGGAGYLKSFLEAYAAPVILAAAWFGWSGDRRRLWLAAAAGLTAVHVLTVGADVFAYFRFVAPWVPVLLALAAAASVELAGSGTRAQVVLLTVMLVTTTVQAGVHGRTSFAGMRSGNGNPEHGLVAGLLVREHTQPNATIAVTAAGNSPYFSHRRAVDLLGKNDARVARLAPHPGAPIGHAKFDMDYSLSLEPDLIVTSWSAFLSEDPRHRAYAASPEGQIDYRVALHSSRPFVADYRDQAVPLDYLLEHGAIYVHRSSPEAQAMAGWRQPSIGP